MESQFEKELINEKINYIVTFKPDKFIVGFDYKSKGLQYSHYYRCFCGQFSLKDMKDIFDGIDGKFEIITLKSKVVYLLQKKYLSEMNDELYYTMINEDYPSLDKEFLSLLK